MHFSITDSAVSEFLSGLIVVFTLLGVGALLLLLLGILIRKFPFTRLSLVLALTPLSLIHFMSRGAVSTVLLFSMISVLLGLTIDGINYVLLPKEVKKIPVPVPASSDEETEEAAKPGMIVWEKAE
ncbi:hypothetical protein P4E94_15940 [Pontiellaceae bacterium B12219]|nr:hypothetical protein [Pontiellaceae bacterium B12219]